MPADSLEARTDRACRWAASVWDRAMHCRFARTTGYGSTTHVVAQKSKRTQHQILAMRLRSRMEFSSQGERR
jgi:hypothetical protein